MGGRRRGYPHVVDSDSRTRCREICTHLRPSSGHLVVDGQRGKTTRCLKSGDSEVSTLDVFCEENPHAQLRVRHYRNRALERKQIPPYRTTFLQGNKDRRIQQAASRSLLAHHSRLRRSSSVVSSSRLRSSRRPGSAEYLVTISITSSGPSQRGPSGLCGTRSATGFPRTVITMLSPASTRLSKSAVLFRRSRVATSTIVRRS